MLKALGNFLLRPSCGSSLLAPTCLIKGEGVGGAAEEIFPRKNIAHYRHLYILEMTFYLNHWRLKGLKEIWALELGRVTQCESESFLTLSTFAIRHQQICVQRSDKNGGWVQLGIKSSNSSNVQPLLLRLLTSSLCIHQSDSTSCLWSLCPSRPHTMKLWLWPLGANQPSQYTLVSGQACEKCPYCVVKHWT